MTESKVMSRTNEEREAKRERAYWRSALKVLDRNARLIGWADLSECSYQLDKVVRELDFIVAERLLELDRESRDGC